MDALVGFLAGPRARGAFLFRSILEPPWGLRIEDEAPLTLVAVVAGETVLARWPARVPAAVAAAVLDDGPDPERSAEA